MPEQRVAVWDSGDMWDDPMLVWGGPAGEPLETMLIPNQAINLNSQTNMEYWEITKDRAQKTLPVWEMYVPTLKINQKSATDLESLIGQFEPLVQERTAAQDGYDEAYRTVQSALLKMKILGTRLPAMIESQLDENKGLMKDVDDLYAVPPRAESSTLKRARMLYPVWVRANTALAALPDPQPPLVRTIAGTAFTAAALKALLDGYTDLIQELANKQEVLDAKRETLRTLDAQTDRLIKNWYKFVKANNDPGSAIYTALDGIPTEPGTPLPDTVEIDNVTQGGEEGRQALVAYLPGGGAHATTKEVQWQVVGTDADFTNTAPLVAAGNALGPFAVGTVVKIRTLVTNSSGSRTTAPRTITIEEPIV